MSEPSRCVKAIRQGACECESSLGGWGGHSQKVTSELRKNIPEWKSLEGFSKSCDCLESAPRHQWRVNKLEGRGEVWSLAGARCCSQVGDRDDTPHQGAMGMERRDNVASDTGDGTS